MRVLWLDPVTGTALSERSRLATELYGMHFFHRVPGGLEFTGGGAHLGVAAPAQRRHEKTY